MSFRAGKNGGGNDVPSRMMMSDPATVASRIYVGNLPVNDSSFSKEDLSDMFSKFGNVTGVLYNRGFAFVQFDTEDSALEAIKEEHSAMVCGKRIDVKRARMPKGPLARKPDHLADRDRGNDNPRDRSPVDRDWRDHDSYSNSGGPSPMDRNSMDRGPMDRGPMDRGPMERGPMDRGPMDRDRGPMDRGPMDRDGGPMDRGPIDRHRDMDRDHLDRDHMDRDRGPLDRGPMDRDRDRGLDRGPMDRGPMDRGPMDRGPMDRGPMDRGPMDRGGPLDRGGPMDRDRRPMDRGPMDRGPMDRGPNDRRLMDRGPMDREAGGFYGNSSYQTASGRTHNDYATPTVNIASADRINDLEIIVYNKRNREYGEYIERRLKQLGLSVDLLFPNEVVPIGRVLANISSRGTLYAIVVLPQNEEHRSLTLNILHGLPQEHRNMPLEDAVKLISRDFETYIRGEKSAAAVPVIVPTQPVSLPGGSTVGAEGHPHLIKKLLTLLSEERPLTVLQYDKVIRYLEGKREAQLKIELGESKEDAPVTSTLSPAIVSTCQEAYLQHRILNILNSAPAAAPAPAPAPMKQGTESLPPLLSNPTVQKALDSLMQGNLLQNISAAHKHMVMRE